MNILYYNWDEFNGEDCRDAMIRLGHVVDTFRLNLQGYVVTEELDNLIREAADKRSEDGKRYYDCLFSFDFFPNLSEVCQEYELPYISWVFDCPHYTLDSPSVNNPVNRVFLFDRMLYEEMRQKGIDTVRYSPLGVNELRLSEVCRELDAETDGHIIYEHDVCFLGNLYDNEYNFYDQVNYLPEELKGYLDGVIASQERFFGNDLFGDKSVVPDEMLAELKKYINFENTGAYGIDYDKVLLDILRKKVTVNERHNILKEMGKHFDTVLYTQPGAVPIENVKNLGLAHYVQKMPRVFHRSKINLNINLRSIKSGVSLRVVDVLAAGGFLITSYQPEIAEYFENGKDLAIAYTPEDMVALTAYYLEHEDERKEIALNGQKKVFENFAYSRLLTDILSSCG
ncbi:MAG: DUF3880 domain-containing protein [Butyrivibrio sp.]|nr:DUF3880 domain-containing protein [Butyrivibrio sp.]